jgi:uncharacterized protein (TIGR00369 family)
MKTQETPLEESVAEATIPRADVAHYTGLELLQRMVDGIYRQPSMGKALDFRLTEVSEGRALFRGLPGAGHLNPAGVVHGGWAATVLDSALGCAVQTTLARGEIYTTIEFKVNLMRPITPETGEIVCEGTVVQRGRTVAVSQATLKDARGRLLAMGVETCAVMPLSR